MKKYIRSLATGVALGSAGVAMMSLLGGCSSQEEQKAQQNKFLVIEQQLDGGYKVIEEHPTDGPSRAIVRERDASGNITERVMNEEEMKKLAQQEYEKFQNGSSELLKDGEGSAGMGLAGTILAVAAGSLLGNMIGNALMGNKSFAQKNSAATSYSRTASPSSPSTSTSNQKSFFKNSSSGSQSGSKTSSVGG